jgi:hypothetical protein
VRAGKPRARRLRAVAGHRRRIVAVAAATNAVLVALWFADVGAMRDPVIFQTGFDVPWPILPALALAGVTSAAAWRRRRHARTTPQLPRAIG